MHLGDIVFSSRVMQRRSRDDGSSTCSRHPIFLNLSFDVFARAHWQSYTLFIFLRFILISTSYRLWRIKRRFATFRVQFNIFVQNSFLSFACYTPSSHHPLRLYHTYSIWWRANCEAPHCALFSSPFSQLLHLVFLNTQYILLRDERPSLKPVQKNG